MSRPGAGRSGAIDRLEILPPPVRAPEENRTKKSLPSPAALRNRATPRHGGRMAGALSL